MLPREHGAYGQLAFPVLTSLVVAGATASSLMAIGAMIALFLAHEPILVLLGYRGRRVLEAELTRAGWALVAALGVGTALGVLALDAAPPAARWAFAVPIPPVAALVYLACTGREKTSVGESVASIAFASAAIPLCAVAGSPATGVAIALAFAVLFVAFTLAVRVIVLRTRGGGNGRAVGRTRGAMFATVLIGGSVMALVSSSGWLPWGAAAAAVPGIVFGGALALFPPHPTRLRRVGWTLIGVSALTSVLLMAVV
jgi:hypothetical protein